MPASWHFSMRVFKILVLSQCRNGLLEPKSWPPILELVVDGERDLKNKIKLDTNKHSSISTQNASLL
jgi:hypothetical protein